MVTGFSVNQHQLSPTLQSNSVTLRVFLTEFRFSFSIIHSFVTLETKWYVITVFVTCVKCARVIHQLLPMVYNLLWATNVLCDV